MSKLSTNDMVIIGSSLFIGLIAIVISMKTRKIEESTKRVRRDLDYVKLALEKSQREIREGNHHLRDGNEMLRKMVKETYGLRI